MIKSFRYFLLLWAVVGLSACSTLAPRQEPVHEGLGGVKGESEGKEPSSTKATSQTPERVRPIVVPGDGEERLARPVNQASLALLDAAQRAQLDGDISGAVSKVERALRISPRNPAAYYQLAHLYFEQGEPSQALAFARKALNLQPQGQTLTEKIHKLIRLCNDLLGSY